MRFSKTELAQEYRDKFPKTSQKTLGALMYKENKEVFKDAEEGRTFIRKVDGSHGAASRKERENVTGKKLTGSPYKIPESYAEDMLPYILPENASNILFLTDIHIPYHNVEALEVAINYGKEHNINTILLGGDTIDFYMASRFEKDPRKRKLHEELEAVRQFLFYLRQEFPNALIYYKMGNHDERLEKYLMTKAPELLGFEEFNLDVLLKFGELKINLITDKRIIKAGKLSIVHGHEFIGAPSQAVNPARGLYLKTNESCIMGHLHKSSSHTTTSLSGEIVTTWSVGHLGEEHPLYGALNAWNLGFAHIMINKDRTYRVLNHRIFKGKIY